MTRSLSTAAYWSAIEWLERHCRPGCCETHAAARRHYSRMSQAEKDSVHEQTMTGQEYLGERDAAEIARRRGSPMEETGRWFGERSDA